MKISHFFLLIAASVLTACNQEADQVQETQAEVLAIHDEVMPRMEEIMSLKRDLATKLSQLDSLQQEGMSRTTLAEERLQVIDLRSELSTSDSLMMSWMHEYRGDSALALPAADALLYFRLEKDKISHVKEKTEQSIEKAKAFLN